LKIAREEAKGEAEEAEEAEEDDVDVDVGEDGERRGRCRTGWIGIRQKIRQPQSFVRQQDAAASSSNGRVLVLQARAVLCIILLPLHWGNLQALHRSAGHQSGGPAAGRSSVCM
jgi:hypothetical protein